MAVAAEARLITVRYQGGYVRATKGALDKLLGETDSALQSRNWGPAPEARRPYGYRRKTNSAAGLPLKAGFADGETWTYRVAGPVKNFIDRVLRSAQGDEVVTLTSPRGAEFAKELEFDIDD
jgi:hypothetical protein